MLMMTGTWFSVSLVNNSAISMILSIVKIKMELKTVVCTVLNLATLKAVQ